MAKVCQEKLLSILGRVLPTSSIDKIFEKKTSQKRKLDLFFFSSFTFGKQNMECCMSNYSKEISDDYFFT